MALKRFSCGVAIILRPLHQRDVGRGEIGHDAAQPERLRPDSRCRSPRCTSASGSVSASARFSAPALKPFAMFEMEEAEARRPSVAAMRFDRPPDLRVGRVVVQHDDFEIRHSPAAPAHSASRSPSAAARCSWAHGPRPAAAFRNAVDGRRHQPPRDLAGHRLAAISMPSVRKMTSSSSDGRRDHRPAPTMSSQVR